MLAEKGAAAGDDCARAFLAYQRSRMNRTARVVLSSRFFGGQDASLILGGTRQPLRAVRVDGVELAQGNGLGQYHWIECGGGRAVLVVRWRSKSTDRIDIETEPES